MSSMKKNVLAVALVAGLGLAGGAAAYNYGTAAFGTAAKRSSFKVTRLPFPSIARLERE